MDVHVLRLAPGEDLRAVLAQVLAQRSEQAACVLSAVGSLTRAVLRYAGEPQGTVIEGPLELVALSGTISLDGPLELVALSGTISLDGPHLHASVSDAQGAVKGGHVMPGCIVRTTAEIVLGLLPQWEFRRETDPATGYLELLAKRSG
jgi:predicted DNA-binding protein with PD1-like motif